MEEEEKQTMCLFHALLSVHLITSPLQFLQKKNKKQSRKANKAKFLFKYIS